MLTDHCGECGAFPVKEAGPLTIEIARLHLLLSHHTMITTAATRVFREMTDMLNARYGTALITPAQVRRWRDMLAEPIEAAQKQHNP